MKNAIDYSSKLSHPLFTGLTSEDLQQILQISDVKTLKKNEILIKEGEVSSLVYVIISGSVSVTRRDETLKRVLNLAVLGPEQVVGEISIVTKKPKSATVTALEETSVLVLDFSKISNLKQQSIYNQLFTNLAAEMAQKIVYHPATTDKGALAEDEVFDEASTYVPSSILLLFGWKWRDIIFEIPFLASHGYDAIKIFPPQEFAVLTGRPWYELYQPVTYNLSSFYGTEEEFRAMVDICHTYNIKVYADLVMNHMAEYPLSETEHIGTNGTRFSKYRYGPLNHDNDVYEYEDFYHYQTEANPSIQPEDYSTFDKTWRVEHFDLNYLPKLNFDNPHVIATLRKYLSYLLYLGVDGFRIDAAKHIVADALTKILKGLKTRDGLSPFVYLEFYAGFPMGMDPYSYMEKYFKLGYVTSFSYSEFVTDAIKNNNNNLEKLLRYSFGSSWVHYPENRSVVLLDNHDTERAMPHLLNYKDTTNNAYVLGYIFMLAYPFGVPKVMSGFHFSSFEDSIPQAPVWQNGRNTCFDNQSPWVAQHRWKAISNMVLFRKKTQKARGITHVWANSNQIAFARSCQKPKESVTSLGFVVINNSSQKLIRKFETGLPAGRYFNLSNSELVEGKMQGEVITVLDYGFTEITVNSYDAVVLCIDYLE